LLPPALARAAKLYPLAGSDYATARALLAQAKIRPTKLVLYTANFPSSVTRAQILAFNLKQIGIDLEAKHFDTTALGQRIAARGEPYDLVLSGWTVDYADPAGFFVPIFAPGSVSGVNLDDPGINRRIEAANRLTGDARRRAWATLDVDLMRTNPPWAPFAHAQARTFVSKSLGCFLDHPIYGIDIAAVCKK
jgi:ABC-type transport system substrate-binding protein